MVAGSVDMQQASKYQSRLIIYNARQRGAIARYFISGWRENILNPTSRCGTVPYRELSARQRPLMSDISNAIANAAAFSEMSPAAQ